MDNPGYFQVYTGEGKGKTTAALGLCLRALGAGCSVYFAQFLKGSRYSEIKALELLARETGRLEVRQFGREGFIGRRPSREDLEAAAEGIEAARSALLPGRWDLVVLDEINVAVAKGLVAEKEALSLASSRPRGTELVFTGRYASESILAAADLVTEMREVRHYLSRGVEAREGIER